MAGRFLRDFITPCGRKACEAWWGGENSIGNWAAFKTDANDSDPWAATQSRDHNLVNELTAIGGSSTHVGYGKPPSGQKAVQGLGCDERKDPMRRPRMLAAILVSLGVLAAASSASAMYHPTLGRWATRDPEGYWDGALLYGYVGGSPCGYVDPQGRAEVTITTLPGYYEQSIPGNQGQTRIVMQFSGICHCETVPKKYYHMKDLKVEIQMANTVDPTRLAGHPLDGVYGHEYKHSGKMTDALTGKVQSDLEAAEKEEFKDPRPCRDRMETVHKEVTKAVTDAAKEGAEHANGTTRKEEDGWPIQGKDYPPNDYPEVPKPVNEGPQLPWTKEPGWEK